MGFLNGLLSFLNRASANFAKSAERHADEWAANPSSGKTADDIRRQAQKIQRDVAASEARREKSSPKE